MVLGVGTGSVGVEMTKEEQQKIWEWCGFIYDESNRTSIYTPSDKWVTPDGKLMRGLPDFTVDNLLKWSRPKLLPNYDYQLIGCSGGRHKAIIVKIDPVWTTTFCEAVDSDPAEALGQAILKVIDD